MMTLRRVRKAWRRGRQRAHKSLQTRMVVLSMLVFSLTAALLCLFSMGTIKGTIQAQVMDESRRDFSSQISLAQKQLSSANLADSSQYQQLIGNLASELQNNGSGNMIGVYLMSGDDSNIDEKTFVPVSTEPEYTNLISTEMQHDLQSDSDDSIYYQAVNIGNRRRAHLGPFLVRRFHQMALAR